jgi:hypothetical protein
MNSVVLGDPPPALTSMSAERQRLGLDQHDEVWDGDHHMAPMGSFNHGRVEFVSTDASMILDVSTSDVLSVTGW